MRNQQPQLDLDPLENIRPADWHDVRQLDWTPRHFHKINVNVSPEIEAWILAHTRGRWAVTSEFDQHKDVFLSRSGLAFEDAQEAMLCQLTWSGHDDGVNDDF